MQSSSKEQWTEIPESEGYNTRELKAYLSWKLMRKLPSKYYLNVNHFTIIRHYQVMSLQGCKNESPSHICAWSSEYYLTDWRRNFSFWHVNRHRGAETHAQEDQEQVRNAAILTAPCNTVWLAVLANAMRQEKETRGLDVKESTHHLLVIWSSYRNPNWIKKLFELMGAFGNASIYKTKIYNTTRYNRPIYKSQVFYWFKKNLFSIDIVFFYLCDNQPDNTAKTGLQSCL